MKTITVDDMVKDSGRALELDVRMGEGGLRHPISVMKVLKPGLILANLVQKHETDELVPDQVVVFGGQEMDFVASLPEADRLDLYRLLFQSRVSCLVVTRNQPLPAQMLASAAKERIPILHTALSSGEFIEACETWLERAIQPSDNRHGEMVDVHGVGIYIFGRSGIGKSECALDLIMRGHRLAADDVVRIWRIGDDVFGGCSDIIQHHMEIRGLGIINVRELFGAAAVRESMKIDLVVELVDWTNRHECDRLGLEQRTYNLLGVAVPFLQIPISPGRNSTTIIEVAARNHLLRLQGVNSAQAFQENCLMPRLMATPARTQEQPLAGQSESASRETEPPQSAAASASPSSPSRGSSGGA